MQTFDLTSPISLTKPAGLRRTLNRLASKRLTVWLLGLLALAILTGALIGWPITASVAVPFFLIFVNLFATVCVNARIRASASLMVLHLALLALMVLAGIGRLTYLQGTAEVLEGDAFSGKLNVYVAGPLHQWNLDKVKFVNQEFKVQFGPSMVRRETSNAVSWFDNNGERRHGIIGDQDGLVLHGYRIYTSQNKGFALLFAWTKLGDVTPEIGSIHMPSYPRFEGIEQNSTLEIPGVSRKLTLLLDMKTPAIDPERASVMGVPAQHPVIVLSEGQERKVLQVGEKIFFPEGTLEYVGLRKWMGYKIAADPTMPWILAVSLVIVLSLAWHVVGTIRQSRRQTHAYARDLAPPATW